MMIEQFINNIINNVINSFDISFCVVVNIATYLVIRIINDIKRKDSLTTWQKRIAFLLISLVIAVIYIYQDSDYKTIFNSIILAPVSWSWIFKPICSKLKIDYNNIGK